MTTRPKPRPLSRRPPSTHGKGHAVPPRGEGATLRLAIGKDGIGLELERPVLVGCLRITALSSTFRGVRFPVDVSGGVARFRHRRGELQRLELEVAARSLERWAAPKLAGIVSARAPDVWVSVGHAEATFCVSAERDPDDEATDPSPAVAFDVHALVDAERLLLIVANARGANLGAAATTIAIACLEGVLGRTAERAGSVFVVPRVAHALLRSFLPDAGARVPSVTGVAWSVIARDGDTLVFHAARGAAPSPPADGAVRAEAIAALLREGDDALVAGDLEAARAAFFDALERAPRHPEIVRRIVEIDARTRGREEAALATFAEGCAGPSPIRAGTTPGELFAAVGDMTSAIANLERVADGEPAPALAARAYERAASLAHDPEDAARWLDHALARAPRAVGARWSRVAARLALGRIEDATADVAHLEALARGVQAKHAVWVRAGRAFQSAGLRTRARGVFERALRYAPEGATALAGLGEALVAEGATARGISILGRALTLAGDHGDALGAILLPLARAFAEGLDDLPTAIMHASSIPVDAVEAPTARGLEARWRARVGDVLGASLAFARLREIAASLAQGSLDSPADPRRDERHRAIAQMLLEAAELERAVLHDPLAAQRHLAVALRLQPHDVAVRRAHREAGAALLALTDLRGPREGTEPAPFDSSDDIGEPGAPAEPGESAAPGLPGAGGVGLRDLRESHDDPFAVAEPDSGLAARADELTRRVQADPGNEAAAEELAALLETLGRGHELLALMLARLEDAPKERRPALVPRVRDVLDRLALASERAGRPDEAALYRTLSLN